MSRVQEQYERTRREIEILCSDQFHLQNIVIYLEELEDYISIRLEALRKQIEREEKDE